MWVLFAVCFVFMLLVIAGMAVGVMNGREPIKGSCGGLNKLGLRDGECPICGDNPALCESEQLSKQQRAAALAKPAKTLDA